MGLLTGGTPATKGPVVYECRKCGHEHNTSLSQLKGCRQCDYTRFAVIVSTGD